MKKGDLVAYIPKDVMGHVYKCEIGKIKEINENGTFVYYHSGDTANKTNVNDLIEIENLKYLESTTLGTGGISNLLYAGYYEDNGEYTVELKEKEINKLLKKCSMHKI